MNHIDYLKAFPTLARINSVPNRSDIGSGLYAQMPSLIIAHDTQSALKQMEEVKFEFDGVSNPTFTIDTKFRFSLPTDTITKFSDIEKIASYDVNMNWLLENPYEPDDVNAIAKALADAWRELHYLAKDDTYRQTVVKCTINEYIEFIGYNLMIIMGYYNSTRDAVDIMYHDSDPSASEGMLIKPVPIIWSRAYTAEELIDKLNPMAMG